ncbi:MAG: FG-GAP-like repeat-containing protein [Pirellulaceae bacterium]|nr:FG-GAP-like repeat-containing protein [Pirellulaceae bacterium]
MDAVEVRLGGGRDDVVVPDLARHVVIRGGGGADTGVATLVDAVGRLDTVDVETVWLRDERATSEVWNLNDIGLSAGGATVLTTTGAAGAVASHILLGDLDDSITVTAVGHETHIETGGGADTVEIAGDTAGLSAIGAALVLRAGDETAEDPGVDALAIDDTARTLATSGIISPGNITGFGLAMPLGYAGFEMLTFDGSAASYDLTVADTSAPTTIALGTGADTVTVLDTAHPATISTGGGNNSATIRAAGAALTLDGGTDHDVLTYAPPAGAAGNLALTGTGENQGSLSPNVTFTGIEEIDFELPESNDSLALDYTFTGTRLEIRGNGGNDTVTAVRIGGTTTFAGGAGFDRLSVQGTGDPTTHFTSLTIEPGLELLALDGRGNTATVDWHAASGGIYLGGVQEGNLLINSDAARETRILGREGDTLTVQELANRAVDATIDGNRVELVTGAQVLSPGTFISDDPGDDTDFTYSLGTLEGVADVATFDQFVYTASAGDNTVGVFEDVGGGQLELRQIVKDGLEGVDSLQGVSRVVISEDGKFVYVSAAPDNALTVFSRNAQSGLLNLIQVVRDGEGGVDGLQGVADLALRGNNLYAASPGDNALAVFAMGQDAQLIFTEAIPNTPSTNVALEKAALQSSTYNNLTYCGADRAVDGNRDPVWHSDSTNSIAHTKLEAGALWEVDLGGDYHLDRVQLFDRYGYPEQLSNFVVMVYNDDVDGEGTDVLVWQSPTISALPAGGLRLDLPGGTVGDRVRIQNQGTTSRPLVIAECEVYSRGVPGLTGINSVTVSEDGTRVYTTADSGSISAFARDPWGNLALLDLARPLFPTDVESNLANRTPFYGPPDNHNYDLRDDYWVVFDLGDYRVFDQPGGDFNVYEAASSDIEFGDEAVDVSEDGVTWFDVTNPRRAALTIPGDEAHGNPAYARSYDISMTGVDSVRYIRVRGIDDDYDSFWGTGNRGFDFDAVGAFVVPAAELSVPGASDVAEIVMGDRRVLHVLAEGGPTLSLFDVSFPGVAGGAIWASLDLTGALNADMIVNNGTGAIDAVQSGWGTEHYSFITQSAAAQLGGTAGNGLPDNGVIAGSPLGFPVQLAYRNNDDGYNAIRLDAGSPVYLTLEPGDQTRYGSLFLLGASCYGDAAIRVELRYADGSTETVSLNVDDWWQDDGELSPNVIPIVNGMDWHHSGSWYNINDAAVFAMPVPADGSKALVGMTFTQLSTSGPSTAILGVMGRVLARPLEGPDIGPVTAIEAMALPPLYLWERFSDGDTNNLAFPTNPYAGRWTVVDQGTITPPSHWFVSGGILRQDSNIYSASEYANRLGTYVYYDDGSGESYRWTNYELEADLHPTDNDGIGLIFRYTDDDNYYKLDMDSQRGFRKLFKMANGVETTLWSDAVSYTPGRWLNVKIRAVGNEIEVLIDDVQIAKVSDASPLTRGTVAVYCWGQQEAQFDNVRVRELRSGGQLPAIFALGEDAVGVYNVDRPSLSLQATDTEPFDGTNPVALHVTEDQISVVDAGIDPTSGLLHTFEIATAHRFNSAGNWPVGNGPASVAVADLNGDGYLDLVTANSNSNNVSVLRGSGNGAFQAATYTSVGTYPFALTVADLNGDGYLDLVTANSSSNNVSVLRGNGNGTFQAATHIGVGTCPYSVAVADLNGDGYPDLVTANHDSNNVSVLRGNGNGTFQAATHIAVGTSPYSVAVADLNGDGYLDLVAANSGSNNVSVLRGNGNGTFQAATHFGVATPYSVAVADLDGKGPPDLVTAGYGGVYVMLGTIGGGYESPVRLSAGSYPWDVAAVDMNGDGYQDLVVANYWSHNVSVLMGYGNGTFQLAMHFPILHVRLRDNNNCGRSCDVSAAYALRPAVGDGEPGWQIIRLRGKPGVQRAGRPVRRRPRRPVHCRIVRR